MNDSKAHAAYFPQQPPEHFTDTRIVSLNWDEEEVPEGWMEVTFLIPETGRRWGGKTIADITIKEAP